MVSDPQPRDANLNLRRPLSSPNAQNGLGTQTHHIHASSSLSLQQNASANLNLGGSAQQDEVQERRRGDRRPVPVYHIPTIRRYLAELDVIAAQKDENALEKWSMEKKVIMSERIRHAVFTEYWSKNCAYRRSTWNLPSKASEFLVLVAVLLALVLLWWDKLVMLEVTMPSVPRWL
ncbi:hypothetical protein CPC08DRAFT_464626 [Agrocybe pediades]|nr:hypothetical protein CPC08DRAFT_464626 [Agrocybe pediades]